jgi:hypothetical protein
MDSIQRVTITTTIADENMHALAAGMPFPPLVALDMVRYGEAWMDGEGNHIPREAYRVG